MSNYAVELADLFDEWRMPGISPMSARRRAEDDDDTFWSRQTHAVALLKSSVAAIAALEADGEDVRGFAPYVGEWHQALFSVAAPWNQVVNAVALRDEAIGALRTLGLVLAMRSRLSAPTQLKRDELRERVAEARALLQEFSSKLETSELTYISRLLGAVDDALSDKALLGSVNLREHIDRLNGALVSVASQMAATGDADAGDRFWKVALKIVATYRGLLADAAAYAALTGFTIQQLA